MKKTLTLLAFGTLAMARTSSAWACPMCKFALESDSNEPQAYMISILFMMGMISALFGSVMVLLWWVTKLEKKNLTDAGYQHLSENAGSQPHLAQVKAE